jgi:hypothetical protein
MTNRDTPDAVAVWEMVETLKYLAEVNAELLEALEWVLGNKWKSDKDNMEFSGAISCYQMDKIRTAVAKARGKQ